MRRWRRSGWRSRTISSRSLLRVLHAYLPIDKKDEVLRLAAELTGDRIEVAELELGQRLEDFAGGAQESGLRPAVRDPAPDLPAPDLRAHLRSHGGQRGGRAVLLRAHRRRHCLRARSSSGWRCGSAGDTADDTLRSIAAIGIYAPQAPSCSAFCTASCSGRSAPGLGLAVIHREDPEELLLLLKIAICLERSTWDWGFCSA